MFRASSARVRHNESRRLQGYAVNFITRLYVIVHLIVWLTFRAILETFDLTTAAIINVSVITSKLSCSRYPVLQHDLLQAVPLNCFNCIVLYMVNESCGNKTSSAKDGFFWNCI